MPAIENLKPVAKKSATTQRVPDGQAWPISELSVREDGMAVVTLMDDSKEPAVPQPPHYVSKFWKQFHELLEAWEAGEAVCLAGGWVEGTRQYDGELFYL